MRTFAGLVRAAAVLLLAATSFAATSAVVPGAPRLQALTASGFDVATHRLTGQAVFIGTSNVGPTPVQTLLGAQATTVSGGPAGVLAALGPSFGIANPIAQTTLTRDRTDALGFRMARYRQLHQGLPVIGGEVVVNLDATGRFVAMAGRAAPDLVVDTTPLVSAAEAAANAIAKVVLDTSHPASGLAASTPELSVYDPRLLDGGDGLPAGLAWRIEVKATDLSPIRHFILIDARTGAVRLQFNQIHEARNRLTYTMANNRAAVLPGTLLCDESNDFCTGAESDAVLAHTYARDTYDYYLAVHGRDSIDNAGMTIKSSINYCPSDVTVTCPYQNAFWNGSQMVYGPNFASADDVVGHEITHGVTERESGLYYYYQSGAINESFSDVFGEVIDQQNGRGNDSPAVKWLMGEDLSIGAIRNMADPTVFGDPDRITSPNYYRLSGDSGGVHFNSGVNNKAAFLMADGGVFNGHTVAPLGNVKMAKIYYRTNANYLISSSDYFDLYNALFQSCLDLVGTSGITATDCASVREATLATEMNLQPVANFNTDAPLCPVGSEVSSVLFSNNMEASPLTTAFGQSSTSATNFWSVVTGYATSGSRSLYAFDPKEVADQSTFTTTGVTIPAGAQLHFRHAFGFVTSTSGLTFYDGGVIEYSINNGATWLDAGSLITEGPGYGGTLTVGSNPLIGRTAFVNASHGYVATRLNLTSLAGQTVKFRWRVGSTGASSNFGWILDDVSIHTCVTAPAVAFTSAAQGTLIVKAGGVFNVTTAGSPAPTVTLSGSLPSGVLFNGLSFAGTPASGTVGGYPVILKASNGLLPDAVQFFTLTVVRQPQVITLPTLGPKALSTGPFTLPATGGASGNVVTLGSSTPSVCSVAGSLVTPLNAGTCTIIATQPGNGDYEDAAPVTRNFLIVANAKKKRVDFNNDGNADILWRNSAGRTAMWLMNGATQVGGRELFGAGTGWAPKLVGDFNGDGYADILFENTDGGSAMWTMNGSTQIGGARLLNAQTPGSAWHAKFVADFDGDGKADILWEKDDGTIAIWLMNGTTQVGGGVLLAGGTNWHVKSVADFNGDGKADLLWENTDGSSALWLMNGTTQIGGGRLFAGGSGWFSTRTADLNGDGMADILWTHTDGRVAVWIMNGATQVGGAVILGAGTGYAIAGVGDINGDGRDDIVWAKADGTTAWWAMNGTAQSGGGNIFAAGAGQVVKRVVDFTGDGLADLMVTNAAGDTSLALFNGSTFSVSLLLSGTFLYAPVIVPE